MKSDDIEILLTLDRIVRGSLCMLYDDLDLRECPVALQSIVVSCPILVTKAALMRLSKGHIVLQNLEGGNNWTLTLTPVGAAAIKSHIDAKTRKG